MFGLSGPWAALALAVVGVVALAARWALFQASCALADAGEPGVVKSLLLVAAVLALSIALVLLSGQLLASASDDPSAWLGAGRLGAAAGAVVLAALVAAGLYAVSLPTAPRKAIALASAELGLGALLAALCTAVVLVVLAGVQISRRSETPKKSAAAFPPSLQARA